MKKLIGILIVLLILFFILYRIMVFFKEKRVQTVEVQERIVPVEMEVVKISPYTPVLDYTGEVKAIEEVDIFPKASGKLVEIKIREGDRVKKDQVVALIDRDITGLQFELAETVSPVEGVVGKVYLDKGAAANPDPGMGTALAQILNLDSVKIVIQVIEEDISKVKLYQKAKIKVDTYPGKEFYGVVTLLSPTLNNLTHTATVELVIPNLNHLLKPGMFAEVELITGKVEELIFIPRYALITEAGKRKVYIVKAGKAEERLVEVGFNDGGLSQIKSGLDLKDSLVISGQSQLQAGDKVRIVTREVK